VTNIYYTLCINTYYVDGSVRNHHFILWLALLHIKLVIWSCLSFLWRSLL